jgi:hypothetical protein
VRDVAAGSAFMPPNRAGELKLRLEPKDLTCSVINTSGEDRAVTLAYCISLDATGWTWWDDPEKSRRIEGQSLFINSVDSKCGADGVASLYPLAVISNEKNATCLAVPIQPPRMVRYVYDPANKELRAEFDFGLTKLSKIFPSRADATVVTYEVENDWPFRRALAKYWQLYPDAFARRAGTKGGIWMPFNDLRGVEHPEDFGFAYHEVAGVQIDGADGPALVAFDRKFGVGDYSYVEPPTYWQLHPTNRNAKYDERLKQLKADAEKGDLPSQATLVSGIERDDGKLDLYLEPVPYTDQAPWGSNADPAIPSNEKGWPSKGRYEMDRLMKELPIGLAGIYIDSMEGWGQILDYRKQHWEITRFPLTFDPNTKKICLMNLWGTYAFIEETTRKLHERNLLLFGNDAYFRFWFLAPHVDVPGREYTWIEKGKFTPVPDERYLFFKAMSGKRPYLMLMNNNFDQGEFMEPYFQRSLFYAVYPSAFTGHTSKAEVAYFSNPEWYNRDRSLFKKYIPLIRKLDEAGWEPVPFAKCDVPSIRIERYGNAEKSNLAFTLHNPDSQPKTVTLQLDHPALKLSENISAREWITDKPTDLKITLPPMGYAAVGISTN